jgi:hypothetical protein
LRRNVFVAFTALFPDGPQILLARAAVLLLFRQVMHDALALEMPRQRPPAPRPFRRSRITGARVSLIVIGAIRLGWRFCFRLPRLPGGRKQGQLIGREMLALAVSFGV